MFDAAQMGTFALSAPPAPWVDLGWCSKFRAEERDEGWSAARPGLRRWCRARCVTQVEATVQLEFESWGKLQLALAAGSQQMNLLQTANGAAANGSGGVAAAAIPLRLGSTATCVECGGDGGGAVSSGELVAVDEDYAGADGICGEWGECGLCELAGVGGE